MWKRVVWDIVCISMIFFAPWWATLVLSLIGAVFFSWYLEMIFIGVCYDVIFGGVTGTWYYHLIHTFIFGLPVLVIEFIKTKVNMK